MYCNGKAWTTHLLHSQTQFEHKVRTRSNAVAVKALAGLEFFSTSASNNFPCRYLCLLGRAEPARSLLIHFGSWSNAINGQIQHLGWLHHFIESIN